jgi:Ca2+-binding EF-hand superfamily protein
MTIDIEKLIEEIDEDGSGQIEFGEFTALLQSGAPEEEGDEND